MCAIDALGIAAMLGTDAVIDAADPVSGEPVRVTFTGGAARWQPESTGEEIFGPLLATGT